MKNTRCMHIESSSRTLMGVKRQSIRKHEIAAFMSKITIVKKTETAVV